MLIQFPAFIRLPGIRDVRLWPKADSRFVQGLRPLRANNHLMPEMPHAGEDHGEAGLVCRRDHLIIPHRAAGLDHGM